MNVGRVELLFYGPVPGADASARNADLARMPVFETYSVTKIRFAHVSTS